MFTKLSSLAKGNKNEEKKNKRKKKSFWVPYPSQQQHPDRESENRATPHNRESSLCETDFHPAAKLNECMQALIKVTD